MHGGHTAESGDIGLDQFLVDVGGRRVARPGHAHLDLNVAARHLALHGVAHGVLEGVEFRRHAEVDVESAMIHALEADDDFVVVHQFSNTGIARHTAGSH